VAALPALRAMTGTDRPWRHRLASVAAVARRGAVRAGRI